MFVFVSRSNIILPSLGVEATVVSMVVNVTDVAVEDVANSVVGPGVSVSVARKQKRIAVATDFLCLRRQCTHMSSSCSGFVLSLHS